MVDITKLLRQDLVGCVVAYAAASEIERLRERLREREAKLSDSRSKLEDALHTLEITRKVLISERLETQRTITFLQNRQREIENEKSLVVRSAGEIIKEAYTQLHAENLT